MKKILLTRDKYAIVDNEDYPYLSKFQWYCRILGGYEYAYTGIYWKYNDTVQIPMHTFLIKEDRKNVCYHKNKNRLDNRKSNICLVSKAVHLHQARKRPFASSIYKGVNKHKNWNREMKWEASCCKNDKRFYLGLFRTQKEAALAYNKKAKALYGKLAYQNIIQ